MLIEGEKIQLSSFWKNCVFVIIQKHIGCFYLMRQAVPIITQYFSSLAERVIILIRENTILFLHHLRITFFPVILF